MRFRQRVAIQAPTEVRDEAGGVEYTYETILDVPANVQAATNERRTERDVRNEELFDVDLGGHHVLTTDMVILDGEAVYDITRVVPTLRREITVVKAERVAI